MEALTFSPAQMHLVTLMSHIKSSDALDQLKDQLAGFYVRQIDEDITALGVRRVERAESPKPSERPFPHALQITSPMRQVVIDTNCLVQMISLISINSKKG